MPGIQTEFFLIVRKHFIKCRFIKSKVTKNSWLFQQFPTMQCYEWISIHISRHLKLKNPNASIFKFLQLWNEAFKIRIPDGVIQREFTTHLQTNFKNCLKEWVSLCESAYTNYKTRVQFQVTRILNFL